MTAVLTLPRMGETMESGRVAAWLKKPGDRFERGETILEIETDKVTVEMPALDSGRLVEILAPEGAEIAVGEPLGRYESATGAPAAQPTSPVSRAEPSPQAEAPPPSPTAPSPATGRLRATPLARRLARHGGLDLAALVGTGRRGRIERRDVEAALPGAASEPAALPGGADVSTARPGAASELAALPSALPALRFVEVPAGRMAYREWSPAGAARRTLLLLHGFGAEGATWASVAAGLARAGTRVVAPDLPAHGATEIEAADFESVVEASAAFAAALDLHGAALLGHSMGGAVAARLAAGGRLAALTLVAPAGLGGEIDADFIHGMANVGTGGALAHLLRRLARQPPSLSRAQLDAMAAALRQGRLKGLAAALAPSGRQGLDIVADLAAVTAPVRLIWGVEDRILPWTQAAAAPSRAAIHLVSGAGHMPHWDRPQDLAALMA